MKEQKVFETRVEQFIKDSMDEVLKFDREMLDHSEQDAQLEIIRQKFRRAINMGLGASKEIVRI